MNIPLDAPTSERAHPLDVLVVEDERLLQWAISETLEDAGCAVSLADDGASALTALTIETFDVVLLDLCLPDSRDLSLLDSLRRRWPATAVVAMTAHAPDEVLDGVRRLGVGRVLRKPFDLHGLPSVLRAARLEAWGPATH